MIVKGGMTNVAVISLPLSVYLSHLHALPCSPNCALCDFIADTLGLRHPPPNPRLFIFIHIQHKSLA